MKATFILLGLAALTAAAPIKDCYTPGPATGVYVFEPTVTTTVTAMGTTFTSIYTKAIPTAGTPQPGRCPSIESNPLPPPSPVKLKERQVVCQPPECTPLHPAQYIPMEGSRTVSHEVDSNPLPTTALTIDVDGMEKRHEHTATKADYARISVRPRSVSAASADYARVSLPPRSVPTTATSAGFAHVSVAAVKRHDNEADKNWSVGVPATLTVVSAENAHVHIDVDVDGHSIVVDGNYDIGTPDPSPASVYSNHGIGAPHGKSAENPNISAPDQSSSADVSNVGVGPRDHCTAESCRVGAPDNADQQIDTTESSHLQVGAPHPSAAFSADAIWGIGTHGPHNGPIEVVADGSVDVHHHLADTTCTAENCRVGAPRGRT
ncbi:MAG: hypothetical protein Q9166_006096 [cf. Caloplaca sp. 2 TL-2023]